LRELPIMIDIWVTYKAKSWLEKWFKPHHVGWEFGSGYSTIWIAKKVKFLTSVDNNKGWHDQVRKMIKNYKISNVKLFYEADLSVYPLIIDVCDNETLDFLYVDGRNRVACVKSGYIKIKKGGILILDNSDRERYGEAFKLLSDWPRLDFAGSGRGGEWQTSIWTKP